MRRAPGLVKDHHVLRVSIFLIVAALVVGMIACDGPGTYQLTVSSASGGNVTIPGEGTFPYDAGTVVQLAATPDEGYQFRSWTGDIAYIADPNTASTTITMNGNYAIVANFATENQTGPDNGGHIQP
jgi:hypothetical protein